MTASPDLLIRTRRAAFNRAIADGDAAAIAPILARDCVMVTDTGSAVIAGRSAQVKVWQREFAPRRPGAPARLGYVRTPREITASPVEPIALEQGEWQGSEWQGSDAATGALAAADLYTAKWREVGGQWVIEAEIFVTLA
ncbi:DUF4440 domain-containing protein [Sphingobium nicotianae]|uniref:DUF4440 domain-containing protein n=1 Tax=Sphingobium nicotianae TaxID=2782607 RepID=A0A9X1DAU2_9SPHN|nr:DUF4440 domain-containing protein [Sphingobium nicotianae]MBT2186578.1 DUF4440 domain-containing protein [Sphingobium nicotianae]